jgi:hypothetical protein
MMLARIVRKASSKDEPVRVNHPLNIDIVFTAIEGGTQKASLEDRVKVNLFNVFCYHLKTGLEIALWKDNIIISLSQQLRPLVLLHLAPDSSPVHLHPNDYGAIPTNQRRRLHMQEM